MKWRLALTFLALIVLLGAACGSSSAANAADAADAAEHESATSGESRPVILLELFTSQGCSSCPPADRLLSRLAQEEGVAALAFHVDYWNYIGWTDPFSTEAWTLRQRAYGRALQADTIYTPQLVIDGRAHVVGSRERDVAGALEAARRRPAKAVVEISNLQREGESLSLTVEARLRAAVPGGARLLVAVVEDGLVTSVGSGENRHHTLRNDRVVRKLEVAGTVEEGPLTRTLRIPLEPEWKTDHLGAVAFVQDPRTLEVLGAARVQ